MPRLLGLRSGVDSTPSRLTPVAREVVALASTASLPAFGLWQRDGVLLGVRLPEAAVSRQVFEKGADAVRAFSNRMHAERSELLDAPRLQRAPEVLAMDCKMRRAVGLQEHEHILAIPSG